MSSQPSIPKRSVSAYARNLARACRAGWNYITKDNADGTYQVEDDCVKSASILASAVTETKIADAAVTNAKIGDNAVSTRCMLPGTQGVNVMLRSYSDFECVPTIYNATSSEIVTSTSVFGKHYLKVCTKESIYLGTSDTDYNIHIKGGYNYILSFYAYGADVTTASVRLYYDDGGATYLGLVMTDVGYFDEMSDTYDGNIRRYQCNAPFDFGGDEDIIINIENTGDYDLYIACIQIEPVIDGQTEPSPWVRGNHYRSVPNGDFFNRKLLQQPASDTLQDMDGNDLDLNLASSKKITVGGSDIVNSSGKIPVGVVDGTRRTVLAGITDGATEKEYTSTATSYETKATGGVYTNASETKAELRVELWCDSTYKSQAKLSFGGDTVEVETTLASGAWQAKSGQVTISGASIKECILYLQTTNAGFTAKARRFSVDILPA